MDSIQVVLEDEFREDSEDAVLILIGKFYPIESPYLSNLKCPN